MLRHLLDTNICIDVIKQRPPELLDTFNRHASHMAMQDGQIRAALERQGQPIGVNDLHIAAHARSEGLTLVSNNGREFEQMPGLLLENWI